MEFLNRTVDQFLGSDGQESSDSEWDFSVSDVENPAGPRRATKSIGNDRSWEHGRPIEMILHSHTNNAIDGKNILSTESENGDSSSEEGVLDFLRTYEPSAPPRKATRLGSGKTDKTRTIEQSEPLRDENHFMWIPHGKFWTVAGIIFAWAGFLCSYEARNSSIFVTVESPIYVDTHLEEIYDVGMVNIQLCFNESHTGVSGCTIYDLASTTVNDNMFQIARCMAFLAVLLGGFFAASITIAMIWSTINLLPIGLGFLVSYFLQSLTFLLFDSELCAVHKCHMARGSTCSIVGSVCWILAGIASTRMEAFKYRRIRAKILATQKANRHQLKPSNLNRGTSDITQKTDTSGVSNLTGGANSSPHRCVENHGRVSRPYQEHSPRGRPRGRSDCCQSSGTRHLSRSREASVLESWERSQQRRRRPASYSPLRSDTKPAQDFAQVREKWRCKDVEKTRANFNCADEAQQWKATTKKGKELVDKPRSQSKRQGTDRRKFEL